MSREESGRVTSSAPRDGRAASGETQVTIGPEVSRSRKKSLPGSEFETNRNRRNFRTYEAPIVSRKEAVNLDQLVAGHGMHATGRKFQIGEVT